MPTFLLFLPFVLLAGCPGDLDSGDPDTSATWVVEGARIRPGEGCRASSEFEVPAGDDCADVVMVQQAVDGTCYFYPCWHEGQAVSTGADGPPADTPDWCSTPEWFSSQPQCPP